MLVKGAPAVGIFHILETVWDIIKLSLLSCIIQYRLHMANILYVIMIQNILLYVSKEVILMAVLFIPHKQQLNVLLSQHVTFSEFIFEWLILLHLWLRDCWSVSLWQCLWPGGRFKKA